jgi:RNA polymerase sigma-70 factor (ECF subfamily)
LCWHIVRDQADAEDLTQEVFIQLFRKIDTFRGEAAFTTWLHRLTVNVVLMRLRKKSRTEPSLGEGTEHGGSPDCGTRERVDPATALTQTIDRLDLEHALAQLPAGYRMVFVLHDVEGYRHGEIARVLGVEAGTSKSQLHKARLQLRDLLRGTGRQLPQREVGRMFRNAAPKLPIGRRVSKRRHFELTPAGGSFQEAIANGQREVYPGIPLPAGPTPEMTNSSVWR